ncbi:hypothetical protein KP509_28G057600 [Ceratopteris richardii]|uniref:Uncharacterized protein n=1 Tax=Ceratopteris richardii TaxID=49495 RepID=A0A8T2RET8_CERRI|nr:hypothetical protein KP509_28G057600 [Ceratopteris richardii]
MQLVDIRHICHLRSEHCSYVCSAGTTSSRPSSFSFLGYWQTAIVVRLNNHRFVLSPRLLPSICLNQLFLLLFYLQVIFGSRGRRLIPVAPRWLLYVVLLVLSDTAQVSLVKFTSIGRVHASTCWVRSGLRVGALLTTSWRCRR